MERDTDFLIDIRPNVDRAQDDNLTNKLNVNNVYDNIKLSGTETLIDKIATATKLIKQAFSGKEDKYQLIQNEREFIEYCDRVIEYGKCAIDVETDGLNYFINQIAGICLYSPNNKPCYVPVNHINYIDRSKIKPQLSKELVKNQLQRMIDSNVAFIFFNATFDVKVLAQQWNIKVPVTYCGYLAQRCLNENEDSNTLKGLHNKYVKNTKAVPHTFGELMNSLPSTMVPLNYFYYYAANDTLETWELMEYQMQYLDIDNMSKDNHLYGVAWHYFNIEIPLIWPICKMEMRGIKMDEAERLRLWDKYKPMLETEKESFYKICKKYKKDIDDYKALMNATNRPHKLSDPINPASPEQLNILIYDILKIPPVKDKVNGVYGPIRNTGIKTLKKLENKHPIIKVIIDYRTFEKVISTYISKLPNFINPVTGNIHTEYRQYGTRTGRLSSKDVNLQNIPSKLADIRRIFVPPTGYVFISCDYSAQELRLCADRCKDETMIQKIKEGLDVYAYCASIVYSKPYEDCIEDYPDGTTNYEGKARRGAIKAIILGILYGKGTPAIANDLGISLKDAQKLYDTVLSIFPKLKAYMHDCQSRARKYGYVTTITGRKCRLPEINLSKYEFEYNDDVVSELTLSKYYNKLKGKYLKYEQVRDIINEARAEGIKIINNSGKIAEMERKCVNSEIQGSASDQMKKAMIDMDSDERLKQLGFELVLTVHDEVIAMCPYENALEVSGIMREIAVNVFSDRMIVPSEVDIQIFDRWNGEKLFVA